MKTKEASSEISFNGLNPINHLGGITFLLFWTLLSTGVYLYLFYEMTPAGAYDSVQIITLGQKYFGGIIRSIHRYSADGIIIVIAIHILRQFSLGQFRGKGQIAWSIGAIILPVMWLEGVLGYFLPWDKASQMIAQTTANMLDALLIHYGPVAMNFLLDDAKNGLIFYVANYVHLAIPAFLLILAWAHCMRITMPPITPPRQITIAIFFALFALAIFAPVTSQAPADLSAPIQDTPIDWLFLAFFRLIHYLGLSPITIWLGGGAIYIIFIALPWIIRDRQSAN